MNHDARRTLRELANKRGDQVAPGSNLAGLLAALDPARELAPRRRASLVRLAQTLGRFEEALPSPAPE